MSRHKEESPFRTKGVFCGVAEWKGGLPRKIELRDEHSTTICKVARELRPGFLKLIPGTTISVQGFEKFSHGFWKRKITTLFEGVPKRTEENAITIQVCAKKNCWERGGREVYHQLAARIEQEQLQHVTLKKADCLGNCRNCPTARVREQDLLLGRVHPRLFSMLLRPPA